ncbi:MAG: ferritin [Pseudomonadota bacterium]
MAHMAQTNSEAMTATLNKLMNGEFRSAQLYFQAAAWCEDAELSGSAQFFLGHASEEMMHMKKLYTYIVDAGLSAKFEALPEPKLEANSLVALLKEMFGYEQEVTANYIKAVSEATSVGDAGTFEFLQWYIMEQREEEKLFRRVLEQVAVIGDGPQSLYYTDIEVSKVAASMGG